MAKIQVSVDIIGYPVESLTFHGRKETTTVHPQRKAIMVKKPGSHFFILVAIIIFGASSSVQADFVYGATAVSSPQGSFGGNPLANIINQSGLSNNYTTGLTDFDSFLATTTHSNFSAVGFTNTESDGPQQFIFDLGEIVTIDAIGIWNSGSVGSIDSIEIFADADDDFLNGTTSQLLGPTDLSIDGLIGQAFEFDSVTTRYVVVNGLSSLQPPDFYGLGEVLFRTSAVPEPNVSVFAIFGSMFLFLRTQTNKR